MFNNNLPTNSLNFVKLGCTIWFYLRTLKFEWWYRCAASRVLDILRLLSSSTYWRHSIILCCRLRVQFHKNYSLVFFLSMRYPCIRRIWPVKSLLIILSLLFRRRLGQSKIVILIFLNLVFRSVNIFEI